MHRRRPVRLCNFASGTRDEQGMSLVAGAQRQSQAVFKWFGNAYVTPRVC